MRACAPWDSLDAGRGCRYGDGNGYEAQLPAPNPNDPVIQCCLTCKLPDGACHVDPRCPFCTKKVRRKSASRAARAAAAMRKQAAREVNRAVKEATR